MHFGKQDFYETDCRGATGAHLGETAAPSYVAQSILGLYTGCRPVYIFGGEPTHWVPWDRAKSTAEVVADLTGPRRGVEPPNLLAGADIERANVPGPAGLALGHDDRNDREVLKDGWRGRGSVLLFRKVPFYALTQVHGAPVPERGIWGSGACVQRDELAVGKRCQDSPGVRWLGHDAARSEIRESGLWNVQHVCDRYDPAFLQLLAELVHDMP